MVEEKPARSRLQAGGSIAEVGRLKRGEPGDGPIAVGLRGGTDIHGEVRRGMRYGNAFQATRDLHPLLRIDRLTCIPTRRTKAVQAFARAVAETTKDPEFIEGSREITGGTPLMAGVDNRGRRGARRCAVGRGAGSTARVVWPTSST